MRRFLILGVSLACSVEHNAAEMAPALEEIRRRVGCGLSCGGIGHVSDSHHDRVCLTTPGSSQVRRKSGLISRLPSGASPSAFGLALGVVILLW